jgi:hypothetical protein
MRVHFDISALKATKWYEYALRFLFGGTITVVTGVMASRYGPVFGGLFLAFPAIFPASATLVEKHEREKKQRAGIVKTIRGREAAALDARGAAIGSLGLIGFAFAVRRLAPIWNGPLALFAGGVADTVDSDLASAQTPSFSQQPCQRLPEREASLRGVIKLWRAAFWRLRRGGVLLHIVLSSFPNFHAQNRFGTS